ncbi:MAG TPA: hypothetical protein VEQ41_02655 [Solirubrobacterales bacterium]|nr:hypothetical protein [Solirubrobacterales bacterium]
MKPATLIEAPAFAVVADTVVEPSTERRYVEPAVWRMPAPTGEAFIALQRWEGIVTECGDETFIAQLTDLTEPGPREEVELPISDVALEDRDLVEVGAVFYWSIGYKDEADGQRVKASTLRFRRLPVWSESELIAARGRAEDVARVLAED